MPIERPPSNRAPSTLCSPVCFHHLHFVPLNSSHCPSTTHAAKHTQESFLQKLGLKPQDCKALEQLYGTECEALMRADPYLALLRPASIGLSLRCVGTAARRLLKPGAEFSEAVC